MMFRLLAAFLVLWLAAAGAQAQTYPDKPIRIIMPFPPGGPTDVAARLIADQLRQRLGQPVVVESRPGANGNIGLGEAAKAPRDGYTLAIITATTSALNPNLYDNLPYDPDKDLVPIAIFAKVAYALIAKPTLPASNLRDFIALLKSKPDGYNGGFPSTVALVANEALKTSAGVRFLSVPYKSDPEVMNAAMRGEVDFYFSVSSQLGALTSSGRLKGIAISSKQRSPLMPDVPTFAEAGMPDFFDLTAWFGLATGAGVPEEIILRLNGEVNRLVKSPDFAERIAKFGFFPSVGTPQEAAATVRDDRARWGVAIKKTGAKVQ